MIDETLAELAAAYGVATDYTDWRHSRVVVAEQTIVEVLGSFGVDARTPTARAAALAAVRARFWRRVLPPTVVQRAGYGAVVAVHCRHGDSIELRVTLEDGAERVVSEQLMVWVDPVEVDNVLRGEATYRLPMDLPLGWHRLTARTGVDTVTSTLVVVPDALHLGEFEHRRGWGVTTQIYAAPSRQSWGMGEFADLRTLASWAAERQADFVLVNPVHAPALVAPIEASPYYPSTRRFVSPLYLRLSELVEYAAAGFGTRRRVDDAWVTVTSARIDRDHVWSAKREALALLWPVACADPERLAVLDAFRAREGDALESFALWCAIAEHHGVPWQKWPSELRRPDAPGVALARHELADRVAFHCWLQLLCDEQLGQVQTAARDAGMALGVMHDLAVGVASGGADAWALQDTIALGATVGAPADAFNQQGQDWQQPPWRPDRLAETGYAAYRDMVRGVLRNAGGIRVDHVLGLSRLWWIPTGSDPTTGTYVHYDAEAMLGILALEAERAGAVVVGEDLGTVAPGVREDLANRRILGSTVLWFECDDTGTPTSPESWRELTLATVTTHDLPTVVGLIDLAHVDLRARLGLLARPEAEERAHEATTRDGWLALARDHGVLGADATQEQEVLALHALLAQAPCRLVGVALTDLVGDPRQQNQPGTTTEYPNWCLPLARRTEAGVAPVLLEAALADPRAERLAASLRERIR